MVAMSTFLVLLASASALLGPASRTRHPRRPVVAMAVAASDVVVMMNGLPGKMGYSVGEAVVARGMELAPVALTGAEFDGTTVRVADVAVDLRAGGTAEARDDALALKAACEARGKTLVAVDFTVPAAAEKNAEFYAALGIPFVMGTTGADAAALAKSVAGGSHSAVIAPNMSKQIVAMQAVVARAARDFPGAFAGYDLSVVESHQSAKIDTSGTAKAVVASLVALKDEAVWKATDAKVEAAIDAIDRVRDEASQLDGKGGALNRVPADHLPGHAYHTYALTAADESVRFELRHNVNGRATYAEGACDACLFLATKIAEKSPTRLFDMIDVLEAGGMA